MRRRLFLCALLVLGCAFPAAAQISARHDGAGGGAVVLGASTTTCDGTIAGAVRYASGCVQFCNGTSWSCIDVVSGCDTVPASFDFTDLAGQTASTLVTSNILPITGTDVSCNTTVSVSGSGTPNFRTCSDSSCSSVVQNWTATNTALDMNGKYLQVRATTSASPSTTYNIVASVGGVSNTWSITTTSTGPCGDVGPGQEGTICSDGSVYAGVSPDNNHNMYVTRCDLGQSWNGTVCTGARSTLYFNHGNTSYYTTTGCASTTQGADNTTCLVNADSDSNVAGVQSHDAAAACDGLTEDGHSDWYLPSFYELYYTIFKTLVDGTPQDNVPNPVISGFSTGVYWPSTDRGDYAAYYVSFSNGDAQYTGKANPFIVRCARKD